MKLKRIENYPLDNADWDEGAWIVIFEFGEFGAHKAIITFTEWAEPLKDFITRTTETGTHYSEEDALKEATKFLDMLNKSLSSKQGIIEVEAVKPKENTSTTSKHEKIKQAGQK
jgi:hypothetical protein